MEETKITPAEVNAITTASADEVAAVAESVIEATNMTTKAADELEHLSQCLADFAETHERYCKNAKTVRNQMSYLSRHI